MLTTACASKVYCKQMLDLPLNASECVFDTLTPQNFPGEHVPGPPWVYSGRYAPTGVVISTPKL